MITCKNCGKPIRAIYEGPGHQRWMHYLEDHPEWLEAMRRNCQGEGVAEPEEGQVSEADRLQSIHEFGRHVAEAAVAMVKARDMYFLGIIEGLKKKPTQADYALTPETYPDTSKYQESDGQHTFEELYQYRALWNAFAVNQWHFYAEYPVVKSWKHSDGELCFGGGWFIVVATLPEGQVSNHYKAQFWDLFRVPVVELPPEYDGHTPSQAADRMGAALLRESGRDMTGAGE